MRQAESVPNYCHYAPSRPNRCGYDHCVAKGSLHGATVRATTESHDGKGHEETAKPRERARAKREIHPGGAKANHACGAKGIHPDGARATHGGKTYCAHRGAMVKLSRSRAYDRFRGLLH